MFLSELVYKEQIVQINRCGPCHVQHEEDLIDEWIALDEGQLMSTLVESVGIEDTRPTYVEATSI